MSTTWVCGECGFDIDNSFASCWMCGILNEERGHADAAQATPAGAAAGLRLRLAHVAIGAQRRR